MSFKEIIANGLRLLAGKVTERQPMTKSVEERWQPLTEEDGDCGGWVGRIQARAQRLREEMKDKIAERAYQKWEQRGYTHGNDEQDWLDAEAELLHEATIMAQNRVFTEFKFDDVPTALATLAEEEEGCTYCNCADES